MLPAPSQQPGETKVYFENSYTNFAEGYQHSGIYVDPQGNVYSYGYQSADTPWSPKQTDSPSEQEIEEKYSQGRKLIRKIVAQELLEKQGLVQPASTGQFSKRVQQGADRRLRLIGVGRAYCSPSLRTVQADLPHTALRLVVHLVKD